LERLESLRLKDFAGEGEVTHHHLATVLERSTLHTHDFFEVLFVLDGRLWIETNGQEQVLGAGSLLLARPADRHKLGSADATPCHFLNLAFSPELLTQLMQFLNETEHGTSLLLHPEPPVCHPASDVLVLMRQRMDAMFSLRPQERSRMGHLFRLLLTEAFLEGFLRHRDAPDIPEWLNSLLMEMSKPDNLREGLPAMRRFVPYHPDSITRAFRRHLDTTPTHWLQQARLDWLANQLAHSDVPILDLAMSIGYENLSHCYHLFAERFGCPPGLYRKRHRRLLF
jgi:AraC family transcriptional regulator, dual regulator of chb operon